MTKKIEKRIVRIIILKEFQRKNASNLTVAKN